MLINSIKFNYFLLYLLVFFYTQSPLNNFIVAVNTISKNLKGNIKAKEE